MLLAASVNAAIGISGLMILLGGASSGIVAVLYGIRSRHNQLRCAPIIVVTPATIGLVAAFSRWARLASEQGAPTDAGRQLVETARVKP